MSPLRSVNSLVKSIPYATRYHTNSHTRDMGHHIPRKSAKEFFREKNSDLFKHIVVKELRFYVNEKTGERHYLGEYVNVKETDLARERLLDKAWEELQPPKFYPTSMVGC